MVKEQKRVVLFRELMMFSKQDTTSVTVCVFMSVWTSRLTSLSMTQRSLKPAARPCVGSSKIQTTSCSIRDGQENNTVTSCTELQKKRDSVFPV
ncbi:hypothetical protein PAMP_002116 [Pampus punctatissimus]